MAPAGEFDEIARLFRPLTFGAPEARGLKDDAAFLRGRPGFELVITQDAMVEGVHFLPGDPPDTIARKLLRVNLSDLAAKGAEPYAAFLTIAWPNGWTGHKRELFASGLGEDLKSFGLSLMGGDTVSTPGPLTASLTLLGWCPEGRAVERAGAHPGDDLLVSGTVGDGVLGLEAARGELAWLGPEHVDYLSCRYRLPEPRLAFRAALRDHASAAADVSDGLLADAAHIGEASGCGVEIELQDLPLSEGAAAWLERQSDPSAGRVKLATGGDDYEVVCAARPDRSEALMQAAAEAGVPLTRIGRMTQAAGLRVTFQGRPAPFASRGWSHS